MPAAAVRFSARSVVAAAAAVAIMLVGLTAASAAAEPRAAAATGAISGTVTAGTSDIGSVEVDIVDTSGDFITSTTTATDGTCDVTGLTAASYLACFDAAFAIGGSSTSGYASHCYNDVSCTPGRRRRPGPHRCR